MIYIYLYIYIGILFSLNGILICYNMNELWRHAIDWMCTPKIHMLKSNPQHGIIWMCRLCGWLYHEGGILINGISALTKETLKNSCLPSTMQGHSQKTAIYNPERRLSPDTKSASTLILDFPASRNKGLLFKSPSSWYLFVIAAQND